MDCLSAVWMMRSSPMYPWRIRAIAACFRASASCSAVFLRRFVAERSAPAATSTFTTSRCPACTALCETQTVLRFPYLHLSRACLGKIATFHETGSSNQLRQKQSRFRTYAVE